jgi:hypothetical protein
MTKVRLHVNKVCQAHEKGSSVRDKGSSARD